MHVPEQLATACDRIPERAAWLERLPRVICELQDRWTLSLGTPFEGDDVSCSWVARAVREDGTRAVLKLGMPHMEAAHEIQALQLLEGDPTAFASGCLHARRRSLATFGPMTCSPWRGYWSEFSRNMLRMKNTILVILIVLFAVGPSLLTNAQSHRWSRLQGRRLVKFNWGCATPSVYPSAKLNRIVKLVMKRNDFDGFGTWGDRAFRFDLNSDQQPEYFVPLDCGGTGNCVWGVFAVNPARELGLITGQYLYVHRLKGQWPEVVTYSHLSAVEGSLTTYRFSKRHYSETGTRYPINHGNYDLEIQGGEGNKMPAFLEKAKAGCSQDTP